MRHLVFEPGHAAYPYCLLVSAIREDEIRQAYLDPFPVDPAQVLALSLHYSETRKRTPAAEMRDYIEQQLVEVFHDHRVQYLLVADSDYFKLLAGVSRAEAYLGYVLDCVFGPWKVVYVPSFRAIFYDPDGVREKIRQGMTAVLDHARQAYAEPGSDIVQFSAYPATEAEIRDWLFRLLEMDCPLAIDIEGFSLKHYEAGIGTISFAWNQHEGIAFAVDYQALPGATEAPYGEQVRNEPVRQLLRAFFEQYLERAIYHNISYDVYVLIYQLYMTDLLDTAGLYRGMQILLRHWDDTQLLTYLATNSCAGNRLSLKDQAQEFAGNYAQTDIADIRNIPLAQLLEYNLIDSLSTWYTYHKHRQTVINDQQEEVYQTLFKPAIHDIIEMQLTGLPLNYQRVLEVQTILEQEKNRVVAAIQDSPLVRAYTHTLNEQWVLRRNQELKVKRVSMADAQEVFNPNSSLQLQGLLYDQLGLPVLNQTKNKQPSTDTKTLTALQHHTDQAEVQTLLTELLNYSAVDTVLTNFIPAMVAAPQAKDGWHYLYGSFRLGGTVSGRLSSAGPNLQNIPSAKSRYGNLIRSAIQAPPGWILAGLDFDSLEDRISALTTKDPNKIKVYSDGFDAHSLRAYSYFKEEMPDIEDSVTSINSIQQKYSLIREKSKEPTFLLTYGGSYIGLMKNCGFSLEEARSIEANYHDLYQVSDAWVQDKLNQAAQDGYVTVAFGLRLRTPLLAQVIRGNRRTPYEAEAEGRTAGNALGQSWCLLNTRAGSAFMTQVRQGPFQGRIKPCAQIHDAQYFLVQDNLDAVLYLNTHLVKAVQWQEHPDIAHDTVKLGGKLALFYPDWSCELTIPNGASAEDIQTIVATAVEQ